MSPADLAHLHLLLNHFPIIGMIIGVALFAIALVGRSDTLVRNSLAVFFVLALIALPAFVTGDAATTVLKNRTDVSRSALEAHQDAALWGFIVIEVLGAYAWLGLWQYRRVARIPRSTITAVAVLALIATGLMSQAGYIGGQIRHAELVGEQVTVTVGGPTALLLQLISTKGVLAFIAKSVTHNGRDLEGAVNRLLAHNKLTGQPVTMEMAEREVRDLIRPQEPKRVKIEDIQRIVARQYNVSRADLLSSRRTANVVRPRQVIMYILREEFNVSYPSIGEKLGGRDHTTVIHSCEKIKEEIKSNTSLEQELDHIRALIHA